MVINWANEDVERVAKMIVIYILTDPYPLPLPRIIPYIVYHKTIVRMNLRP